MNKVLLCKKCPIRELGSARRHSCYYNSTHFFTFWLVSETNIQKYLNTNHFLPILYLIGSACLLFCLAPMWQVFYVYLRHFSAMLNSLSWRVTHSRRENGQKAENIAIKILSSLIFNIFNNIVIWKCILNYGCHSSTRSLWYQHWYRQRYQSATAGWLITWC